MDDRENFWGEPISRYTDADALEDGILVAINPKDRVTRAVFDFLSEHTPMGPQPPDNWPVEMMGWFRAEAMKREEALKLIAELGAVEAQHKFVEIIRDRKALAMAKGLIGREERTARRVFEQNEGGGIHTLCMGIDDAGVIRSLSPRAGQSGKILWLLPNDETGGMTLMFPEDY